MTQPNDASFAENFKKLINDLDERAKKRAVLPANLFRILGRTYSETWHSAFLGWLLDPQATHGLKDFPLKAFLKAVGESDGGDAPGTALLTRKELVKLASDGAVSDTQVFPNERDRSERTLAEIRAQTPEAAADAEADAAKDVLESERVKEGRIDVWIEQKAPTPFACIVEMKVKAPVTTKQLAKYAETLESEHRRTGRQGVCVFIAKAATVEDAKGDPRWYRMNYQQLYEKVLAPCSEFSGMNPAKFLIDHYMENLSYTWGARLAMTQEEGEWAERIFRDYGDILEQYTQFDRVTRPSLVGTNDERRVEVDLLISWMKNNQFAKCAYKLTKQLPPIPFIEQLRDLLEQNHLSREDWTFGGEERSLKVEFVPFTQRLETLQPALGMTSGGFRYGPLAFYLSANKSGAIIKMQLIFYGGSDADWKKHGFDEKFFKPLAQALRAQGYTAKSSRTVHTWHFQCAPNMLESEVRRCHGIITKLAPVIEAWWRETPR